MYLLDAASSMPLHVQLYEAIKSDIVQMRRIGEKLPSIRKLANEYAISKTTVQNAYSQLYAEGYIESRPKSGYFVSDSFEGGFPVDETPLSPAAPKEEACRYDFFPVRLSKENFPLKLWKRLYVKAVDGTLDFGSYPDGQGEPGLRREIAGYLQASRAVRCTPEQIVIGGAFMDTMTMIADLLQRGRKHFAIEHPGYHVTRKVFERLGYVVSSITVDRQGLDIDGLIASGARVVYITPSHQYPTGVAMPVANRLRLLTWARESDGYIIEDDYDSELTYRSRPIPSLQGLDTDDRVIYVGTFAKALSPALRVGYVVLPHRFMEEYRRFHVLFPRVSLTTQKTLELFIKEGHWARHLRRVRNLNRKKHDRMKKALTEQLGDSFEIVSEGGGLAIHIRPKDAMDLSLLETRAREAGIRLYFAKRVSGGEWEAIRMGFGGFDEAEIDPAVKAFAEVWHRCRGSRADTASTETPGPIASHT